MTFCTGEKPLGHRPNEFPALSGNKLFIKKDVDGELGGTAFSESELLM